MSALRRMQVHVGHFAIPKSGNDGTNDLSRNTTGSKVVLDEQDVESLQSNDLFSVQGKIALVTGGSRGIGRMMVSGLIANGAKVYVCARTKEVCEQTCKAVNNKHAAKGGEAIPLPGNLASIEGVKALVKQLKSLEHKLHILVNNAGTTWGAPLEEYPDNAWEKLMNLNVRHVFNLTVQLLPLMDNASSKDDPCRVVNIGSVDGVRAIQSNGPFAPFAYTASKAAVIHLGRTLSRALSNRNITVNNIAPGFFPSNMTEFAISTRELKEQRSNEIPLKRVGKTSDMAGAILYLVSKAGAWVTGTTLVVDGGQIVHPS